MWGDIGEQLPHPVTDKRGGLNEVCGRSLCFLADLVVVDDLSRLHDCPCEATLCQVLAIVARGLPVVTRASWVLALGDSECIPKESVIRHRPLAIETKCVFQYDAHFEARSGNLLKMLLALSKLQNSQWQVRRSGGCGGVAHEAGHELVVLTGVGVLRSWIKKHRRIHNVLGSNLWSLKKRFVL